MSPATPAVWVNAAILFCCEAPEMFCALRNFTLHRLEVEKMMTKLPFLGDLFLNLIDWCWCIYQTKLWLFGVYFYYHDEEGHLTMSHLSTDVNWNNWRVFGMTNWNLVYALHTIIHLVITLEHLAAKGLVIFLRSCRKQNKAKIRLNIDVTQPHIND